jgi:hypothetical protein
MNCVLQHLTYSPGLDFFLFSSTKNHLKGPHFERKEELQNVTMAVSNNLQENYFWKFFGSCKSHWNSCTAAGGNYSEGNHCTSASNLTQCLVT